MKIQFIYTFESKPQNSAIFPVNMSTLDNVKAVKELALSYLSNEEKQELVKISCCVDVEDTFVENPPQWYLDCNGKLWFENGKLI